MLRRTIRTTDHLTERYGKGSWVLITGGSDGIALEMAKELARKQFNLVLVARNADKLKAAAEQIKKVSQSTQVKTYVFDFSSSVDSSKYTFLDDILKNIDDLSILINSVGSLVPGDFEKVSIEKHKEQIDVGIMPATIMTKRVMHKIMERKDKTGKRGAIVYVNSVQNCAPIAGTATYGASKIFSDYMSRTLSHENRQWMDVMTFQCGLVSTNFIGNYKGNMFTITPEQAAYGALKDLGYEYWTHGHIIHDFYAMFLKKNLLWNNSSFNELARQKANNVFDKLSKSK